MQNKTQRCLINNDTKQPNCQFCLRGDPTQNQSIENSCQLSFCCSIVSYPVRRVIYHFGISFDNVEDKLTVPADCLTAGYSSDKRKSVTR